MLIAAFFCRFNIPDDARRLFFHRFSGRVKNLDPPRVEMCKFPFVQVDYIFGMGNQCGNIGGKIVFSNTDAQNQRTCFAHRIQFTGMLGAYNSQRIRTFQPRDRFHNSSFEISFVIPVKQMHDDFRIRLAFENKACVFQFLPKYGIIFDDPIMYNGEPAVIAHMRMGVNIAGCAVRGPTGMPDPSRSLKVCAVMGFCAEIFNHPLRFCHLDPGGSKYGNARGVIAPVFQLFQALQQNRRGVSGAGKAYDSTHIAHLQNICGLSNRRACTPVYVKNIFLRAPFLGNDALG